MRRWNLLVLVALLAVVMIAPSMAKAAASSSTSTTSTSKFFKGRAVAKNSDTHYFVLSFTCSAGQLSAGWTYEVDSMHSFTGTLDTSSPPPCALVSTDNGAHWSTGTVPATGTPTVGPLTNIPLIYQGSSVGMLTLFLTDIGASKTFFPPNITKNCTDTTVSLCIEVDTNDLGGPVNESGFSSQCSNFSCTTPPFPYATLNLSVR